MFFVLMTVGKAHSGKTSFGRELAKRLGPCCFLDSDEVADTHNFEIPITTETDCYFEISDEISEKILEQALAAIKLSY